MILNYPSLTELVEQVNAYMAIGWQPTGGICITYESQTAPAIKYFAQAIVK